VGNGRASRSKQQPSCGVHYLFVVSNASGRDTNQKFKGLIITRLYHRAISEERYYLAWQASPRNGIRVKSSAYQLHSTNGI
jgi:hypothetical protein